MNCKRWARNGVMVACIVSLVGCALPIEPKYDRKELAKKGDMAPMPTVKEVRNIADAWTTELDEATRNLHMQDLIASEVLFYGTLLFTAGSVQIARHASEGWRRARNVGAGAAAGSELLRSHYKPENQALAFKQAAKLMKCVTSALQPIPAEDAYAALFTAADKGSYNAGLTVNPKDLDTIYNAVPAQTLEFIEKVVLPKLQADLAAISFGTPTKAELTAVLDKYKADKKSADTANSGGPAAPAAHATWKTLLNNAALDPQVTVLRQKAVVTALATFASELALCKPTT